jgi:hypothetical protein
MEALRKENVSMCLVVLSSYKISSFLNFTTFLSLGRRRKKTPCKNPYVACVYFCGSVLLKFSRMSEQVHCDGEFAVTKFKHLGPFIMH